MPFERAKELPPTIAMRYCCTYGRVLYVATRTNDVSCSRTRRARRSRGDLLWVRFFPDTKPEIVHDEDAVRIDLSILR